MVSSNSQRQGMPLMAQQNCLEDDRLHDKTPQAEVSTPDLGKQASIRPPFWLTRYALIMFFFILIAFAAALIALDRVATAQNGLPLSVSSSEYSWTYGPTAVLVVVLSLWRRIDYYYKSAQPWRELQSGPVPTSNSLLLDYLSPFQLQSMFQALKSGHYQVAATILSFFLLKGIILVSTTLFIVQPSIHSKSFDIAYQDSFDAANAWNSPPYHPRELYNMNPLFTGGSEQWLWTYLARLNNAVANDTTWNPQNGLVTQRFGPKSTLNLTSLEAPVDVFIPKVTCEDAPLNVTYARPYYEKPLYRWNSSTCSTGVHEAALCPDHKLSMNARVCDKKPWAYTMHRVDCTKGVATDDKTGYYGFPPKTEDLDIRYAITAAHNDVDQTRINRTKLLNYSTSICKIDYGIVSAAATHDLLSGDATLPSTALDNQGKLLPNFTSLSLAEMLMTSLDASGSALVVDKNIPISSQYNGEGPWLEWKAEETLFQLMTVKLGREFRSDIFLRPSMLEKTSTAVLKGLLNEFARESLLVDGETTSTAEGLFSESRLHIKPVVVWVMVAGFLILAVICLLMVRPASTESWIPAICGSIAGHAALLVKSQPLQEILRDTGHFSEKELNQKLDGMHFTTTNNPNKVEGFCIEITDKFPTLDKVSSEESLAKRKAWLPITGRLWFVIATLASPILVIGILELLQQLSDQRNGLVDMDQTDSTAVSYVVRISSTMVAFVVATMFNSVDFTIVTFSPYSTLRSRGVRADKSILFHLLSVSPFLVLFKSLRLGHLGAAASNISSLVGEFLTIIVSGLWILTGSISVEHASSAMVGNWTNSWDGGAANDSGAAMTLNLTRFGGANTSTGIWQDLVLPDVSLPSNTSASGSLPQTFNYTYTLGALRPLLNCAAIPKENLRSDLTIEQVAFRTGSEATSETNYHNNITAHFPITSECIGSKLDHMINYTLSTTIETSGTYNNSVWIGYYYDLNTTENARTSEMACPSVGILFGQVTANDTSKWDLAGLVCSQGIEQVPMNITYKSDPALRQIDAKNEPRVARDKAWRWQTSTTNSDTYSFKLKRFFEDNLAPFPGNKTEEYYDSFFSQLLLGPHGRKREQLAGYNNVDSLTQAVEMDYSEYMRNVIDLNFRARKNSTHDELISASGEASSSSEKPSSASIETTGTASGYITRLGIHSTSKLIPQILLAVMAAFGLAGYFLVRLKGILPRNSCNLASTMAFLAGSQLCNPDSGIIPQGAEFMSDDQLKQAFNGWTFSSGWWQSEETSMDRSNGAAYVGFTLSKPPGAAISVKEMTGRRFGVDVGRANVSKL
ncbi:hypothetical protein NW762_008158 [Fusarium torreyae]|uniref:Uncharacterized protein n=1 Tax=Fusarium torreyae TaxID=1237075 RepID=A0A9W8VDF4_9HYPO|nr:hypothetical protein NW762_008158 [Fusarium torreyae]